MHYVRPGGVPIAALAMKHLTPWPGLVREYRGLAARPDYGNKEAGQPRPGRSNAATRGQP